MKKMIGKLQQNKGETLVEILVSILIAALAAAMLAYSVAVSARINKLASESDAKYYEAVEAVQNMTESLGKGTMTVNAKEGGTADTAQSIQIEYFGNDDLATFAGGDE